MPWVSVTLESAKAAPTKKGFVHEMTLDAIALTRLGFGIGGNVEQTNDSTNIFVITKMEKDHVTLSHTDDQTGDKSTIDVANAKLCDDYRKVLEKTEEV